MTAIGSNCAISTRPGKRSTALPTPTVDDGFARTTIELACVAAEEDLSQRAKRQSAESRRKMRGWIAAGVTSAVIGFVMMRALEAHRTNALLADLPVIEQIDALQHVPSLEFLRGLESKNLTGEMIKDKVPFDREVAEFTSANSTSLPERREWVSKLSADQKADLSERARAFAEMPQSSQEKERLRKLVDDIRDAPDAAELQKTLVAYGQWLSPHSAAEKQRWSDEFKKLNTAEQVDFIARQVQRDYDEAAHQLSNADVKAMHKAILDVAKEKKAALLEKLPAGDANKDRMANMDAAKTGPAMLFLRVAMWEDEGSDETINRLISKLSLAAREHWEKLPRWPRERRRGQLSEWIRQAMRPKWGPADLEKFFASSDKLTNEQRQNLLDMPKSKMQAELERLYLKSELNIDDQLPLFREGGRGLRNGPESGRPGFGRPGRRLDGPRRKTNSVQAVRRPVTRRQTMDSNATGRRDVAASADRAATIGGMAIGRVPNRRYRATMVLIRPMGRRIRRRRMRRTRCRIEAGKLGWPLVLRGGRRS